MPDQDHGGIVILIQMKALKYTLFIWFTANNISINTRVCEFLFLY